MAKRDRSSVVRWLVVAFVGAGCSAAGSNGGTHTDGGDGHTVGDTRGGGDTGGHPIMCTDIDNDGIQDALESHPMAGVMSDDDNDGFSNLIEGVANYPGYTMHLAPLMCGTPNDCDADGIANFKDTDSDNDGLTDAEELMFMTNPCNPDTDGDGFPDLVEVSAGTDPNDGTAHPSMDTLFVTLPYETTEDASLHVHKQFTFSTRIQNADVFFVVDNSGSMDSVVAAIDTAFAGTIIPGIQAAIPNLRVGVGSFDSVPDDMDGESGSPGDYTLYVRQPVSATISLSVTAMNNMHDITDTLPSYVGGDYPEDQLEATYELVSGAGMTGHLTDANARASVHNALVHPADGWVPTMIPATDCPTAPDDPTPFGWACFFTGRVPIIVLVSDASWWNGSPGAGSTDPNQHSQADLSTAMNAAGAYFIGVDVGEGMGGDTYGNAVALANATGTLDAMGNPIVFGIAAQGGGGSLSSIAPNVVTGITTIATESPQNITTAIVGNTMTTPTSNPIASGHTSADFLKAVTPDGAMPPAPTGYNRSDATTFYGVLPSTNVIFDVDFYNDFQPGGDGFTLFTALINVLGRASSIVDHHDVYIIVPANGATVAPG